MSTLSTGPAAHRRFLVFTSAGDRANLHRWLAPDRTFDLWVTYYGDHGQRYRELADIYTVRKGSKFQNLLDAYQTRAEVIQRYDAIMVMDDDVIIAGRDINRLFHMREALGLWVLQPAFSPFGRVSYPVTRVDRTCHLRYTNFVENTCPLFQRDKLDAFMKVYDPILVSYGVDWWFMDTLGDDIEGRVAVIDDVTCINPWLLAKGGGMREISRLQPLQQRRQVFFDMVRTRRIRSFEGGVREYSRVRRKGLALAAGYVLGLAERLLIVEPLSRYATLKIKLKGET